MKTRTGIIILAIVAVFVIGVIIISNTNESNLTTTTTTTTTTTRRTTTTRPTLSLSERQEIAEEAVLKEYLRGMMYGTYSSKFKYYDVNATRYKVGKVEREGNKFEFYITFYLYDNYGNFEKSVQTYGAYAKVDEYGNVEHVYASWMMFVSQI